MKIRILEIKNWLIYFSFLIFFSCNNKKTENYHPEIFKPNWNGIKTDKLKFKIGDLVSVKSEKEVFFGIVMDYDEDEMGIWYGICLSEINNEKEKLNIEKSNFFGRQIPNGLINTTCIDCFDLIYLNEKSLAKNIERTKNISLNIDNISIGARSTAVNFSDIRDSYNYAIKERLIKPTKCDENVLGLKRVDQRYMKIDEIIK